MSNSGMDDETYLSVELDKCREQLEAAQAELAEARDIRDGWKDYSNLYKGYANEWSKDNANLRAQLAEAQATLKASVELCNIREEQLQAEKAEAERLREALTIYADISNWQDWAEGEEGKVDFEEYLLWIGEGEGHEWACKVLNVSTS